MCFLRTNLVIYKVVPSDFRTTTQASRGRLLYFAGMMASKTPSARCLEKPNLSNCSIISFACLLNCDSD